MPLAGPGRLEKTYQSRTKRKGFLTIGWTALSIASGGCRAPPDACDQKPRQLAVFVPTGCASRLTRMLDAKKLGFKRETVNYHLRK
jgi:hypothetical protein